MQERNIGDVIDRIKAEVPKDLIVLRADLANLRGSVSYTAPEMMRARWGQLAVILGDALPDPDAAESPAWAKKIQRIVTAQE